MRKKIFTPIILGIFLLSVFLGGKFIYSKAYNLNQNVKEKIALAAETENTNAQIASQNQENNAELYTDPNAPENKFSDTKAKNFYRLIRQTYSAFVDDLYYVSDNIKYEKDPNMKLYLINVYSETKSCVETYKKFLQELEDNPHNWKNVWQKYREFEIERRAKVSLSKLDPDEKKRFFFTTPEGKELAKQNNITEEQIEKERDEYQKLLEEKKKEVAEQLDEWAKRNGIIE
ncbi:hypothetical protein Calkr_0931 [Caldicellulosiruptor acetigenus I77R1B]|uniref:Uncharacterized protein n=1 Tax=Caldicellulosiruptor acetigenus (strain ATCC 700853 / DSM 12137 / I77R1B) TaxID=632335 RepID=E4S4S7_CALA7|nr:hypothetical protein [Caldicellulosiruptor acetigenus]ADQ40446.1 hypothetical protein Calkr_0931 [Caldicellulosiruptor acetigenus I77R1B]